MEKALGKVLLQVHLLAMNKGACVLSAYDILGYHVYIYSYIYT